MGCLELFGMNDVHYNYSQKGRVVNPVQRTAKAEVGGQKSEVSKNRGQKKEEDRIQKTGAKCRNRGILEYWNDEKTARLRPFDSLRASGRQGGANCKCQMNRNDQGG